MCVEEDSASIVMEYMSGGSLEQLFARRELTLKEKLRIIKGIAAGLYHLHSENLVCATITNLTFQRR